MAVIASQLIGKVGLEGSDKTKADLTEIGKKAGETESSFKKLREQVARGFEFGTGMQLAQIPGSIFDAAKEQVVDIIKLAMDHQQIMAQTNQVLKSTHDVSKMTADALDELAQKFGKTTQFSADTVQQGENLLLTFTNIGHDVFPQATQAILDVSQAMGQDLKESAIQVGKALGDPLHGFANLQRIGVTFSDSEKEQIKTMMAHNNIIGAQKVILKELATEFGGSAQAAGKTFAGALKIASDNLEEVKIKIGTALMPILNDLLNKNIIPLANRFSDWMTKGGGLQDFQRWAANISSFMQNQLLPALNDLLNQKIIPLAQEVQTLWMGAVNLFTAFQRGEPYANAIAIGIGSIGTAIALINIEEFAAGWLNTFNAMNQGNGVIANMAARTLPELGSALGWTKTQAQASAVAVEGIGVASVEAEGVVVASSAAMTLAMGAATLGISLLVGAVIAGITADTIKGQTAMSETTKKSYDALGKTADDITAKQKADATVTEVSWKTSADGLTSRWAQAGEQIAKSSADARAKMILDQQKIADAARKAADDATASWSKWVNDMWAKGIDVVHGGKVPPQTGPTILPGGHHLPGHASGILNSPVDHWAMVGERGPEPMYVPRGASILPSGSAIPSGGQGGMLSAILMLDGVQFARLIAPYTTNHMRYSVGSIGW